MASNQHQSYKEKEVMGLLDTIDRLLDDMFESKHIKKVTIETDVTKIVIDKADEKEENDESKGV